MAGLYGRLSEHIAAFAVVYGIFLSFGEFGPGDNIGLLASKTCATPIRGQYYAIAAATGKIGAFIAVWCFPVIEADGGTTAAGDPTIDGYRNLFWVASSMAVFAGAIAWFFLPEVNQNTIDLEDRRFRAYLKENGYDTHQMGLTGANAPIVDGDHTAVYEEDEKHDMKYN